MTNTIYKFYKSRKSLFIFLSIVLIFFIINKTAKIFLKETKMEKRTQPEFIEKVYGKDKADDYKIVLSEQLSQLEYEPFVEFKENNRLKNFTSVSKLGNRCNKNNIMECRSPSGGKNEIWIFGGSTVFGYGLKNDETISSYLEVLFDKKFRVINFGTGYFNSTQERILFNNLLTKLPPPKAVIFINGLNEFVNNVENDESHLSSFIKYKISKSSKDDLMDYLKERILRLNIFKLIVEKTKKKEETNKLKKTKNLEKTTNIYLNNQKLVKSIADSFNIDLFYFLQPVPIFLDSYSTSNVPKYFQRDLNSDPNIINVKKGYEIYIDKKLDFINDLSNFRIKDPMYIDGVHYSSEFNLEIAKLIRIKLNY